MPVWYSFNFELVWALPNILLECDSRGLRLTEDFRELKVENNNWLQHNFDIMRMYALYKNFPVKKWPLYSKMVDMLKHHDCHLI
jgi:hypothetical protein